MKWWCKHPRRAWVLVREKGEHIVKWCQHCGAIRTDTGPWWRPALSIVPPEKYGVVTRSKEGTK